MTQDRFTRMGDMNLVVTPALPLLPSHQEDARRAVRHGYADVLAWLGEKVGPAPGTPTHAIISSDPVRGGATVLFVSSEYAEQLRSRLAA